MLSQVTRLQTSALLKTCFNEEVGGTGCLHYSGIFSITTQLALTFSFSSAPSLPSKADSLHMAVYNHGQQGFTTENSELCFYICCFYG